MTKPSVEKQPQVITSPDGKVQIINHRIVIGRFGDMAVEGAVRNISSESDITAEVKADLYDAEGIYVDYEVDKVRRLNPGKTGAFEVVYSAHKRYRVKHIKISLKTI